MNTELTLKKFLAEKLPERIRMKFNVGWWHTENHGEFKIDREVLDTEWDYITRLVEEELPSTIKYRDVLRAMWLRSIHREELSFEQWLIRLDWPTRATALMEIL